MHCKKEEVQRPQKCLHVKMFRIYVPEGPSHFFFFLKSKSLRHFLGFLLRLPLTCKPTMNVSTVLLLDYHNGFLLIFSVSLNLTTTWISFRTEGKASCSLPSWIFLIHGISFLASLPPIKSSSTWNII